jgi:hypothetical protein
MLKVARRLGTVSCYFVSVINTRKYFVTSVPHLPLNLVFPNFCFYFPRYYLLTEFGGIYFLYCRSYLKDLIETAHIFLKLLEHFCSNRSIVVQTHTVSRKRKTKSKYLQFVQTCVNPDLKTDKFIGNILFCMHMYMQFCSTYVSLKYVD